MKPPANGGWGGYTCWDSWRIANRINPIHRGNVTAKASLAVSRGKCVHRHWSATCPHSRKHDGLASNILARVAPPTQQPHRALKQAIHGHWAGEFALMARRATDDDRRAFPSDHEECPESLGEMCKGAECLIDEKGKRHGVTSCSACLRWQTTRRGRLPMDCEGDDSSDELHLASCPERQKDAFTGVGRHARRLHSANDGLAQGSRRTNARQHVPQ